MKIQFWIRESAEEPWMACSCIAFTELWELAFSRPADYEGWQFLSRIRR